MEPQQTPNPSPQNPYVTVSTTAAPVAALPTAVFDQVVTNKIWSRTIKRLNYVTFTICAGLLLVIDLPIRLKSPKLAGFLTLMLLAFGSFVVCLLFELWASKKLQSTPQSSLDSAILTFAVIRNIIIGLNVIPLIQIIGLIAYPLVVLSIVVNATMIIIRLKQK